MKAEQAIARTAWVDYAKAIGIILVVIGHAADGLFRAGILTNETLFRYTYSVIYTFHMPLFFFLAGLFFVDSLHKRGPGRLILSKIDTIIYPYIVWSLIQGLTEVVLSNYTSSKVSLEEVMTLLWNPRQQFWFLYALFLICLLCTVIYTHASRRLLLPLVVLFAVANVFRDDLQADRITTFLLSYTVFFAAGIYFNEIKATFLARPKALAVLTAIIFVESQYYFHATLGLTYASAGLPLLLTTGIAILFVVTLSASLAEPESLARQTMLTIGAYSMTIFVMHTLASSGARIILSRFLGVQSAEIHLLVGIVLGVAAPLAAQALINRYHLQFLLARPALVFDHHREMEPHGRS